MHAAGRPCQREENKIEKTKKEKRTQKTTATDEKKKGKRREKKKNKTTHQSVEESASLTSVGATRRFLAGPLSDPLSSVGRFDVSDLTGSDGVVMASLPRFRLDITDSVARLAPATGSALVDGGTRKPVDDAAMEAVESDWKSGGAGRVERLKPLIELLALCVRCRDPGTMTLPALRRGVSGGVVDTIDPGGGGIGTSEPP